MKMVVNEQYNKMRLHHKLGPFLFRLLKRICFYLAHNTDVTNTKKKPS